MIIKASSLCAFLMVFAVLKAPLRAATAPVITKQPQNTNVTCGGSATFSVTASGALTYQWRQNGGAISGATSAAYTTPSVGVADNGAQFTVVVSNGGGSVTSSPAVLTVVGCPAERFTTSNVLPPPDGMYVSPQLYHQLYANGIIISNISHRRFTQSEPPPPAGTPPQVHAFGSEVDVELSTDGGHTFTKMSAPAQVQLRV